MFDVSYETVIKLVHSMREIVEENPIETNMLSMISGLGEACALHSGDDGEDLVLFEEMVYWYNRLYEKTGKEEYRERAEKIQKDLQWKKAVRKWQEEWDDTLTGEDESRPD